MYDREGFREFSGIGAEDEDEWRLFALANGEDPIATLIIQGVRIPIETQLGSR